ncbi:MAG: peroxidase [Alphaproteobacteria bacterium]|nr:MAG: peroxidase [Alphaproteobacteria bacterium]
MQIARQEEHAMTDNLFDGLSSLSQKHAPHPQLEYRSIDGSGNNLSQTDLNAAGTDFTRIGPANFADGVDAMTDGPNPRTISNVVVGQGDAAVPNPEGLSAYMYAWGQFIDHDLDLAPSDGTTHIDIPVPAGDPVFPDGSVISMTRAVIDPATGHDGTPATAVNAITGWLDASMVYGSDQATSDSLRLADGHMKTSDGSNLPIENGAFLAGDVRAQENPSLTALQTLFVREHNYQVDQLHQEHPTWSGDHLYEQARAIVTAEIQNITYSEFLPHLLGPNAIAPYHGYDPTVDPRITEEFAGAAYRFGHSIVSDDTERLNEQGAVNGATLELKDTFFMSPTDFTADSGADGFLRHLGSDPSQALDARIVDGLRNFLFDPPDGQDLAAINIQRGHDLGLGTLNQTRVALGLEPYSSFEQITSDPGTLQALKEAYGSVDNVDLWTGGLSENHLPGAMVGQTFGAIIATQFENLRDGDRLWFQNQGFDAQTLAQIEHTTLADIIERDTDTQHIQDDAFVYYDRHSGTAGGVPSENPDAPQLVIGSAGPDTLTGGPKGDILVAGTGQQTMTGGDGADKFVFDQAGPTDATITDFRPGTDKIELDGLQHLRRGDLRVNEVNGNTVIHVGDDQITLAGVTPHQLSPQDFITVFAPTAPPSGQNSSPHAGTTDMVNNSTSQLVQAMAGFGGAGGAADALNAAPLGADTSQQNFLATPHAS